MSNTQKKQAKRKARKKEQKRHRSLGFALPDSLRAAMHATTVAEQAGFGEPELTVAFHMGMMSTGDTWDTYDAGNLVSEIARHAEMTKDAVSAALDALVAAGVFVVSADAI